MRTRSTIFRDIYEIRKGWYNRVNVSWLPLESWIGCERFAFCRYPWKYLFLKSTKVVFYVQEVGHSKQITHYDLRSGFPYYKPTGPIARVPISTTWYMGDAIGSSISWTVGTVTCTYQFCCKNDRLKEMHWLSPTVYYLMICHSKVRAIDNRNIVCYNLVLRLKGCFYY